MHLPHPPARPQITRVEEVYLDESSHTNHRYLVIGCIIAIPSTCRELEHSMRQARLPQLPHGELKWTKVSGAKLPAYERVVDAFFAASKSHEGPHFHCLVVDTTKVDNRRFNAGSRDLGFSKEVYQLLMKLRRLYPRSNFHVYPDRRSTATSPEELRDIVNHGSKQISPSTWDWPYRRVHWRDSKDELAIQMVDLLIGALAFRLNEHHLAPDASAAKCALSERVVRLCPVSDVTRDTAISGRFTIWHRQLQK